MGKTTKYEIPYPEPENLADIPKDAKTTVEKIEETIQTIDTATKKALDNKVDKEEGKGLSTNDYTNEDKAKLIPTGGTTGQVLVKKSDANNDVEWVNQTGVVATVVDSLESTSATDALSAKKGKELNDKIMPTVLYMADGNTVKSDIPLNDNVNNYDYLDIQFKKAAGGGVTVGYSRVYKENYGMYNALTSSFSSRDNKVITIYSCIISLAANKITINNGNSIAIKETGVGGFSSVNELAILSVRGYKRR